MVCVVLPVKDAFIMVSLIIVYLTNRFQLFSEIEIVFISLSLIDLIDSVTNVLSTKLNGFKVRKSLTYCECASN